MLLFDEYVYEAPVLRAPESPHPLGLALGLALILIAWAPIAWLIWTLT